MLPSDEMRFAELKLEWDRLRCRAEEGRLIRWRGRIALLRGTTAALRSDGRWCSGPADFFRIIGKLGHETYHSSVLAWLLRPDAPHGLGDRMLRRLRERLELAPDSNVWTVRVECEVSRGDTRADVVVWCDDATIVIENKVYAGEQGRQCERLYERFQDAKRQVRFVFLSPNARKPETDTHKAFRVLGYQQVRSDLEDAIRHAPQETTGTAVARNYLETLGHLGGA